VTVELEPDAITRNILTDIKDRVDSINFPEDVEDPRVTELSTSNSLVFELLLY
jgi:multidrug efflux pump subunit AcrB